MSVRKGFFALAVLVMAAAPLAAIPASAATVAVDAVNFSFQPRIAAVQKGDTVTWTNKDPQAHTVSADDGSFSHVINPGETTSITFPDDGAVPYYCKFHGAPGGQGMSGVVQVGASAGPTVRLAATDNISAAIAWSKLDHEDGTAPIALLARDDVFADSLSSGGAQGALPAPLLLTKANSLDARVSAELKRLGVRRVYILGGNNAVSPAVESALQAQGISTSRVFGSDRIGTATTVAERFLPGATGAVIARAFGDADPTRGFADSLAAGSTASALHVPLLISQSDRLSDATKAYIQSHPIQQVILAGGEAALSGQVQKDLEALKVNVDRAAGFDRAGTADQLNNRVPRESDPPVAALVDGTNANSWAAGLPAAEKGIPVVLSAGDTLPGPTVNSVISTDPTRTQGVCAPFVTATACDHALIAESAGKTGERDAALISDNEVPGPGDPKGSAIATIFPTSDPNTLCWDIFGVGLEPTAGHIHKGAKGVAGPIVVPLTVVPSSPDGDAVDCAFGLDGSLVKDIVDNPSNYYVNVHTADFPNGAIRGQLFDPTAHVQANLVGEAVVPGPGDKDGVGFAFFAMGDPSFQLCGGVFLFGPLTSAPTAASIRKGNAGQSGPVVATLKLPDTDVGGPIACYNGLDQNAVNDIEANPTNYYVQVDSQDHPNGAIRGQLEPGE
jgi:putative cell wall-binding protein